MREIKFRAFDVSEGMTYFTLDGHTLKKGVKEQPLKSILQQEEGYELMQYTGLKDKNGKEIYEGDVVKSEPYEITAREVKWFYEHWEPFEYYMSMVEEDFEIIGNIYENPELLK